MAETKKPTPPKPKTPTEEDFADVGAVIGGVEGEGTVAGKLTDIHARTGTKPVDVFTDNLEDPTISDDLLSDRRQTPRAYETVEQVIEDGVSYDVETRSDGSKWLLGRTGEEHGGAAIRLEPLEGDAGGAAVKAKGGEDPEKDEGAPAATTGQDGLRGAVRGQLEREDLSRDPSAKIEAVEDIGRGLVSGVAEAGVEILKATRLDAVADWLESVAPLGEIEVPKPTTMVGQIAEPLAQAGIAMIPAARLTRAFGAVSAFLRWTMAGAVVDFAAFAPDDPGLGDLAKDIGKLDNLTAEALRSTLAGALAHEVDDTEFEKRLKSVGGGVLAGATIDGLRALYRAAKSPAIRQAVQEFAADESGMVRGAGRDAETGVAIKVRGFKSMYPYDLETGKEITEFSAPTGPHAGFFTDDVEKLKRFQLPEQAQYPVDIQFNNPKVIDARGKPARFFQFDVDPKTKEVGRVLDDDGNVLWSDDFRNVFEEYDGLIIKNTGDEGTLYIPKSSDQIGSAISPLFTAAPIGVGMAAQDDEETQVAGMLGKILGRVIGRSGKVTPVDRVLSRISVGQRIKNRLTWSEFYTSTVDDISPVARAVRKLTRGEREMGLSPLAVADDPYKLFRLNRGVNGKAEHFLEYSPFKFGTFENVGKSLKQVLDPVKDRLDDIRAYAVAKRSLELEGRGITTGVDQADAAATVAQFQDLEPVFRDLVEYQDHVLAYLRDSGVLSESGMKAMREANQDYVPFFRLMDDEPKGGLGRGLRVYQPTKKIKGSEREIIDPLESIIKNTYLMVNLADRNAVGDALWRLAEKRSGGEAIAKLVAPPMQPTRATLAEARATSPEVAQLLEQYADVADLRKQDFAIFRPNTMVVGNDQIVVYREGKRHLLQVDPEIANSFKALDHESAGALMRILGAPARLLRAGAILSPEFIARNPFRDQFSAFVFSDAGFIPFLDLARGMFSLIRKDVHYQDWLKSGGPMATLVSLDRQYLQQNIGALMRQTTLGQKVVNVVKSPIEALRLLSEFSEQGTRIGEFKLMTKGERGREAIQAGGFASREVTLDFNRIGSKTRAVNAIIAFWNANVQGTDKLVRSFRDHPMRTTAKAAAGITLPSAILHLNNRLYEDDPKDPNRYSALPQWQRDIFWLVRIGDTWWRIPKPFELGIIFGTGAERIIDQMLGTTEGTDDARKWLQSMGRGAMPGFMPTFMGPPMEQWANRNLFTDRPIIPAAREKLLSEYQYSAYTTEAAKAVGKLIAQIPGIGRTSFASPSVLENYVRGWSGGLGTHIMNAADFALRKAGVLPDPVKPARTLADIPFVKGFVVRHPSAGAEVIQKFYDDYDLQQKYQNTIKTLIKEGAAEESIEVLDRAVAEGAMLDLGGIRKALSAAMKTVRLVYRNPTMRPDEKRQLIDAMYSQMIGMATLGNEIIKSGKKAAKESTKLMGAEPPNELPSLTGGIALP